MKEVLKWGEKGKNWDSENVALLGKKKSEFILFTSFSSSGNTAQTQTKDNKAFTFVI